MTSSTQSTDVEQKGCPYVFQRGRFRGKTCGAPIKVNGFCSKPHAERGGSNMFNDNKCDTFEEAIEKVTETKTNANPVVKCDPNIKDNKQCIEEPKDDPKLQESNTERDKVPPKSRPKVKKEVEHKSYSTTYKLKYKNDPENEHILEQENIKQLFNGDINGIDISVEKFKDDSTASLTVKHKNKIHVNRDKLKNVSLLKVYS